jgi:Peptidase inhibitor family I36
LSFTCGLQIAAQLGTPKEGAIFQQARRGIMSKKALAVIVGLVACAGVACDDGDNFSSPTGVIPVMYQDTDFRGDNRAIGADQPDLDDLPGCGGSGSDWNDCISSIRVPSGWEVTVFEQDDYSGTSTTFTADVNDLERVAGPCGNDWDDCISSIRVRQR